MEHLSLLKTRCYYFSSQSSFTLLLTIEAQLQLTAIVCKSEPQVVRTTIVVKNVELFKHPSIQRVCNHWSRTLRFVTGAGVFSAGNNQHNLKKRDKPASQFLLTKEFITMPYGTQVNSSASLRCAT